MMNRKTKTQSADIDGMILLAGMMGGDDLNDTVNKMGQSSQQSFEVSDELPRKIRPEGDMAEYDQRRNAARALADSLNLWSEFFEYAREGDLPKCYDIAKFGPESMSGKEILEAWGVKFLEDDGNGLFVPVVLPEGWKKERTDHYMWSNLLDDKGRRRASIFYKPDFWDREAFLNINKRFVIQKVYLPYDEQTNQKPPYTQYVVEDSGTTVFTSGTHYYYQAPSDAWSKNREDAQRSYKEENIANIAAQKECLAWLDENYPNHRFYLGHWDD